MRCLLDYSLHGMRKAIWMCKHPFGLLHNQMHRKGDIRIRFQSDPHSHRRHGGAEEGSYTHTSE